MCRHLASRREGVHGAHRPSEFEGAEGVERPVCRSADKFVGASPELGQRLRTFVDVRIVEQRLFWRRDVMDDFVRFLRGHLSDHGTDSPGGSDRSIYPWFIGESAVMRRRVVEHLQLALKHS